MDAVTHLLVGYLLGVGLFEAPAVVAFATFMAFFPDLDTIAWVVKPLQRRLPHRGPTHSLLVGGIVSAAGALALSQLGYAPFHVLLAAGLVGFLSHVTLDVLNWGCALFWPFIPGRRDWTVQQGLTGPLAGSVAGWALVGATRFWAPAWAGPAVALVGLAWAGWLALRVGTRAYLHFRFARAAVAGGHAVSVRPTGKPLEWRIVREAVAQDGTAHAVEFHRYRVGRGLDVVASSRIARKRVAPPITTSDEATAFAFALPEVQRLREALGALHVTVEAAPPDSPDWRLRWWSGWSPWRDGAYFVEVRLTPQGGHEAKLEWLPSRPPLGKKA